MLHLKISPIQIMFTLFGAILGSFLDGVSSIIGLAVLGFIIGMFIR